MNTERMRLERAAAACVAEIDRLCTRFAVPDGKEPSETVQLSLNWQKDLFQLKVKEARDCLDRLEKAGSQEDVRNIDHPGTSEKTGTASFPGIHTESLQVTRLMLQQAIARAEQEILLRESLLDRYRVYDTAVQQGKRIDQTVGMEQERMKLKNRLDRLLDL